MYMLFHHFHHSLLLSVTQYPLIQDLALLMQSLDTPCPSSHLSPSIYPPPLSSLPSLHYSCADMVFDVRYPDHTMQVGRSQISVSNNHWYLGTWYLGTWYPMVSTPAHLGKGWIGDDAPPSRSHTLNVHLQPTCTRTRIPQFPKSTVTSSCSHEQCTCTCIPFHVV